MFVFSPELINKPPNWIFYIQSQTKEDVNFSLKFLWENSGVIYFIFYTFQLPFLGEEQ